MRILTPLTEKMNVSAFNKTIIVNAHDFVYKKGVLKSIQLQMNFTFYFTLSHNVFFWTCQPKTHIRSRIRGPFVGSAFSQNTGSIQVSR